MTSFKFYRIFFTLVIGLSITACTSMKESSTEKMEQNDIQEEQAVPLPQELKRPVVNSIAYEIPNRFKESIKAGTRTAVGKPGPDYWQQYSEYDIDVKILPKKKLLKGSGTIVYHNNSPNALEELYLEIDQNLRNGQDTTAVTMKRFVYNGHELSVLQSGRDTVGYVINGTVMKVELPNPLPSGQTATMEMKWYFEIPQSGASGRMGYSQGNFFFIAYWYPQMRVYDDVIGWFTAPFTGGPEFYHGFADYEVSITAPEQWIVAATGVPANLKNLLQEDIKVGIKEGYDGTDIVRVVGPEDFGEVTVDAEDGFLTWEYSADRVSDFAFSVTKQSIWEATTAPVGDLNGDGETDYAAINSFFRTLAPLWDDAARYTQHSIKFLSDFTGLAYPWPHMTSVEGAGIIGGGMEYPMMTLIGPYNSPRAEPADLYSVIAHEVAHMWVPMQLANNERRYAWMDEGTTTFNEGEAQEAFPLNPDFNSELGDFQSYLRIAGTDREGPIMRWSEHFYLGGYGVASYPKPSSALIALRGVLGKDVFMEAYHAFMDRWQFKHPYPWDMFSTFEDISGRNLDWFWRSWYYTTWVLDQAVGNVDQLVSGAQIVIQDKGNIPMPATVKIWLSNGQTVTRHIDVETWLRGAVQTTIHLDTEADVKKVVIDPEHKFPDADRSNNFWVSIDKSELSQYAGTYEISPAFSFRVFMEDNHLMIEPSTGQEATTIFPKSETVFLIKGQPGEIEFAANEEGEFNRLILHIRGRQITANKVD